MTTISDADVQALAAIAATLEPTYRVEGDPWAGSPFAWIRTQKSRRVGKIGEQLVSGFLAARDFDIAHTSDSEADRLINGHRAEIKFSTLWEAGIYKFQQIRNQEYEFAVCLGVSPFDAHCWVLPKSILLQHVIGTLGQHGGAGGQDTAWISLAPNAAPVWMRPYGGRLAVAVEVLSSIAKRARSTSRST